MTQSEYKDEIIKMSLWKSEIYKSMEFQINCNNKSLLDAIEYRKSFLTGSDINYTSGYLGLGIFQGFDDRTRSACFCVCFEAEYQRRLNKAIKDCSPYEGTEAIFQNKLINECRNGDLINYRPFKREESSNVFSANNEWGYFDSRIPAQLFEWVDNCFCDKPWRA